MYWVSNWRCFVFPGVISSVTTNTGSEGTTICTYSCPDEILTNENNYTNSPLLRFYVQYTQKYQDKIFHFFFCRTGAALQKKKKISPLPKKNVWFTTVRLNALDRSISMCEYQNLSLWKGCTILINTINQSSLAPAPVLSRHDWLPHVITLLRLCVH